MHALKAENLTKKYGKKAALLDLNLEIPQGKIVALLGPNGSGKSTLIKLFAGLIHPTIGQVQVLGQKPGIETKKKVAYVPEFNQLHLQQTVWEAVLFARAFFPELDLELAQELLEQLHLEAGEKVGNLSKGMQARVKIVLALARSPEVLLLDEPLSGLDPSSRHKILTAIVETYRPGEQTILFSTHQVLESEATFEQVIFLRQGELALWGDAEELRQEHNSSIEELFTKIYEEV